MDIYLKSKPDLTHIFVARFIIITAHIMHTKCQESFCVSLLLWMSPNFNTNIFTERFIIFCILFPNVKSLKTLVQIRVYKNQILLSQSPYLNIQEKYSQRANHLVTNTALITL